MRISKRGPTISPAPIDYAPDDVHLDAVLARARIAAARLQLRIAYCRARREIELCQAELDRAILAEL